MLDKMIRIAAAGALAFTVMGATTAFAKDGDVIRRGSCSGATDWKLKLSPENGKIEVEYEVDSNKVGQTWRVRLFHDGNRFFAGTRTTAGASGSSRGTWPHSFADRRRGEPIACSTPA